MEQVGNFSFWKQQQGALCVTKTSHHLVGLPPLFHEHLTVISVFLIVALTDRKAAQLAEGQPRKEEAKCPAQDSTGTPGQSKGSSQMLQVPA